MPHGFYSVSEIIVSIIGEVFSGEYFAFEFKVFDERIGPHVFLIFKEDVMFDFHGWVKNKKQMIFQVL